MSIRIYATKSFGVHKDTEITQAIMTLVKMKGVNHPKSTVGVRVCLANIATNESENDGLQANKFLNDWWVDNFGYEPYSELPITVETIVQWRDHIKSNLDNGKADPTGTLAKAAIDLDTIIKNDSLQDWDFRYCGGAGSVI